MKQSRLSNILVTECGSWLSVRDFLRNPVATSCSILNNLDGTFTVSRPLTEQERPEYDHLLPDDEKEPA